MASSKEMQQSTRPLTHQSSVSAASASGLMTRQAHSRNSSHSILSSSLNANHRVTRRKSMTNNTTNVAAVEAALKEANADGSVAMPIGSGARRNTASKSAAARAAIMASLPSPPASLPPQHRFQMEKDGLMHESAIDDDPQDMSADEGLDQKASVRRASDGQPLIKEQRKSNRVELRCEKCGKGYKHSSCLTKHLWEHTPEWSFTSKLLISKHQQVQLLEAATVLVAMNGPGKDSSTPPESAKDFQSDPESAPSPEAATALISKHQQVQLLEAASVLVAMNGPGKDSSTPPESAKDFQSDPESAPSPEASASGYSDSRHSSADTTPPPQIEGMAMSGSSGPFSKRYSGFGRSYQSAPSTNPLVTGSMPSGPGGFAHFRHQSQEGRPPSSGRNTTGQEDHELAAAVELLSCSFNSNNGSRTVNLPADVPPVPPLPSRYLDQAASFNNTGFLSSYPSRQPESFTRGEIRHRDTKAEESDSMMDDDEFDRRSRSRSDEDDDGVFGRMEE
ncbi:hypothetical protein BN1723_015591 [Verticillium longisporum]|uniref:C2H2-type domain-containing protein n=1 Tax=Verticillium longisporum TaxID=100787 RepID=A0A0G4MZV0_VERLO|nr:hypothetical protein BN1723_015591 [Verticillium longisporum]